MISCLRDVNFNKTKFSFEKEAAEAVFCHAALFTEIKKTSHNDKMQSNF